MLIKDILNNRIAPFEVEDDTLKRYFSYFLHLAPSISSASSLSSKEDLNKIFQKFIENSNIERTSYRFYNATNIKEIQLKKLLLSDENFINRRSIRFVCRKKREENDMECILRHIRNSIAHSNVFLYCRRKRKFIIIDDFNNNGNQTARILLSQTTLASLKRLLS